MDIGIKKEIEEAIDVARARSSLKIISEKSIKTPKVGKVLYGRKTFKIDENLEQMDLDISEFKEDHKYEESNKSFVVNDFKPKTMKKILDNTSSCGYY